jgi:hypothetical protein
MHSSHLSHTLLHARHTTTYSGAYSIANPEKENKREREKEKPLTT